MLISFLFVPCYVILYYDFGIHEVEWLVYLRLKNLILDIIHSEIFISRRIKVFCNCKLFDIRLQIFSIQGSNL